MTASETFITHWNWYSYKIQSYGHKNLCPLNNVDKAYLKLKNYH
jgi:hypothetical protein